jgi:hypothetical protein
MQAGSNEEADGKKRRAPQRARRFLCSKQRRAFGNMRRAYQAAGKKIPAFRRANDTLFNVSERSAR